MESVHEIEEKVREIRSERYIMQSIAKKAIPDFRVSTCLRTRIRKTGNDHYEDIKVWKHQQTNKAFYSGLNVCASVWTCPVCAAKISERRKLELEQAFKQHQSQKGHIGFLTLTFKHSRTDKLDDILQRFTKALSNFRSGKRYNNLRKRMGMLGSIRSFEITYSNNNGFHPHVHIAIFYTNVVDLKDIQKEMQVLWFNACNKVGLFTLDEIGCKLKYGKSFSDYLAKHGNWNIESEMTKSNVKKGKKESLTPFDFLRKYYETENDMYLGLYREYARATKGKLQLAWSKGLKAQFIIEDKTDEQVAKEKTEEADILGLVDFEDWKKILRYDLRSKLLDNVEKSGFDLGLRKTLAIAIKKESSRPEDSQTLKI